MQTTTKNVRKCCSFIRKWMAALFSMWNRCLNVVMLVYFIVFTRYIIITFFSTVTCKDDILTLIVKSSHSAKIFGIHIVNPGFELSCLQKHQRMELGSFSQQGIVSGQHLIQHSWPRRRIPWFQYNIFFSSTTLSSTTTTLPSANEVK